MFYIKHKLSIFPEEKSDLDRLVDCIESQEVKGKELDGNNKGFRMLEKLACQQGEGVGKYKQGSPFPISREG